MATGSSSSSGVVPTVSEEPYQPLNHNFPRHEFGQKAIVSRSFQSSWFSKWKWLHYDASRDVVYCHTCVTGVNSSKLKLTGNAKESAFIYGGFSNWKDATRCFNKHEFSVIHKTAVDVVVTVPKTCDVGGMLSAAHALEKKANQQYLFKLIQNDVLS